MMERRLFDWADFNDVDYGHLEFLDCTLKQDIGALKKGTYVESISINYFSGELVVFDSDGNSLAEVTLALIIVETD